MITTALDQLQLDIQSASINTTSDGYALDIFYVLDQDGSIIEEATRADQIHTTLQNCLAIPGTLPDLTTTIASRRLQHFRIPTLVDFVTDSDDDVFTQIRISTADRPGILSIIARALLDCSVSVQAAKIITLGERIEDVFFVLDERGEKINNAQQRDLIKQALDKQL